MSNKLDQICPQKKIKVFKKDQEWMNHKIQKIRRLKACEYMKKKKSPKFIKLQNKYLELKSYYTKKYIKEKVEVLKSTNPSKFYTLIKEAGAKPGEVEKQSISLANHIDQNLTDHQSAEKIAQYFSSISREYPPLDVNNLPPRVKARMEDSEAYKEAKNVFPHEILEVYKKRKPKKSSVPGDIPRVIKKEFDCEISNIAADIFNTINQTGMYPRQWVREYVTPVPKVTHPETEDDIRPISLTSDMSRDYNKLLCGWLLAYILPRLDPGQFGGLKGGSITHYLILFLNFILSKCDRMQQQPTSVIASYIDFSKGFNRLNHNKILIRLSDWRTPTWLLKVIASYLTERSLIVRYKGVQSQPHPLPGGCPQGDELGQLLFLVGVSDAGMDPPPPIPMPYHPEDVSSVSTPTPAVALDQIRLKYIDDLTLGETVQLQTDLCPMDEKLIGPPNYHDRRFLMLPSQNSKVQKRLNDLSLYVKNNQMKINTSKTKIQPFNYSSTFDFTPS